MSEESSSYEGTCFLSRISVIFHILSRKLLMILEAANLARQRAAEIAANMQARSEEGTKVVSLSNQLKYKVPKKDRVQTRRMKIPKPSEQVHQKDHVIITIKISTEVRNYSFTNITQNIISPRMMKIP